MAVGSGRIPLNAAITIAGAGTDDKAVQAALQEAYESGKVAWQPTDPGASRDRTPPHPRPVVGGRMRIPQANEDVTTSSLVRNYQREVERQKLLVRKAETAQRNLLFIVGALRQLLADENFTNLLRAEGLDTLPQYLADRVWARGERRMSQAATGLHSGATALCRCRPSCRRARRPKALVTSRKFKQIIASIEAVGLIEPLSVGNPTDRASTSCSMATHVWWR
jgi:hypothetical protein